VQLTEDNIISVYAGYRPLLSARGGDSTAKLSRTHAVLQSPSGLVTIVGGKLTTYRRMAQDTVDVLSRRDGSTPIHPTQNLPLQGSAGWQARQRDVEVKGLALGLSPQTIKHLRHYGSEALALLKLIEEDPELGRRIIDDLPFIRAEVIYACRHEMAMTPYDVLARRTSIMLEDRQRGLGALDDVVSLMAIEHNWSLEQQQLMGDTFRSVVQQQLAVEQEQVMGSISIPPKKG
jgi:glycerol-3-phosphate dehydrogenase